MTNQSFNLDLIPKGVAPMVHVSQYDYGQTWNISLFANDSPFNVPSGATVLIEGTKPDNTGFQYSCTFSDNVVTVTEEQQMTVIAGKVPCEIVITQSGALIASLNFYLLVEAAALKDDTVISETDLPLIEEAAEAVSQIPALIAQVEEYAEDAEAWATGEVDGTPVPQTADQYHNNAKWYAEQAAQAAGNPPIIGNNGNWWIYDDQQGQYVDSGDPSQGDDGVTPVISATATVDANTGTPSVNVTKSGTDAAPSFAFAFSNLKGAQGDQGNTGPAGNGIVSITKTSTSGLVDTYTITYTNGTTSTFTVTNGQDGQGAGDMTKAVYDSDNAVNNAGGIAAYVHDDLITETQWTQITALY